VRRHELDVVSLVFGLFLVGAAAIWGLSAVPGHPVRGWALPVLLIAVGAVGLLTSLAARHARADEPADGTPVASPPVESSPTGPADPD
jgi:hypothetical protein